MLTLLELLGDEPVTAAQVRLAYKSDLDELDPLIDEICAVARQAAEHATGRLYRQQRIRAELRSWPSACEVVHVFGTTECEASYWNGSTLTVLDASAYEFAAQGSGTILAPKLGTSWPTLADKAIGPRVRLDFKAGPEVETTVPSCVKLFIKAHVIAWLETPSAQRVSQSINPNPMFDRLLDSELIYG